MSRARWTVLGLGLVAVLGLIVATTGEPRSAALTGPARALTAGEEWTALLASVDHAIDGGDIGRAVRAWRDAYGAALGTRRWEPMYEVGRASLRIGRSAGPSKGYDEKARQCYLTALFRARQQRSAEGALLVAEGFADLGDVEVAARAIYIAETLTPRADDDGPVRARVGAVRARLRRSSMPARDPGLDPAAAPLFRSDDAPGAPPRRRELRDAP
jgi:hypothetical protein